MPRKTQQEMTIESRRTAVARLYLRGRNQQEIADELGFTRKTVWDDIKEIRKEWQTQRLDDTEALINRELARLDHLEAEAFDAWERSKQDAEQETVTDDPEKGQITKHVTTGQTGDPQYLAIILKCCERRCRLLGLDAPAKTESKVDLTVGGPPLTREEMYRTVMERIHKLPTPSNN